MDEARREVPVWRIEHTYMVGSLPVSMEPLCLCLENQSNAFFGFVHTPILSVPESSGSLQSVISNWLSIYQIWRFPRIGPEMPLQDIEMPLAMVTLIRSEMVSCGPLDPKL